MFRRNTSEVFTRIIR